VKMYVSPISFSGINVKIPSNDAQNKNVSFLYNHVLDTVNELHLPAIFHTDRIEVSVSDTKLEKAKFLTLKEVLNKLHIKFNVD